MEFKYTAQNKEGGIISAQAKVDSISLLISQLKNQGLIPLKVKEIKARKNKIHRDYLFSPKIKLTELVVFTRQLSSTVKSGLLLTEALETIGNDLENRYFSKVIKDIVDQIRSGSDFSFALARYPNIFSPGYIAVIRAGEKSGNLTKTINELSRYLENTERLVQKVKSATRYPIFLICFCILIVSFIVFFVIPKFESIFSQFNFPLPLLTRIVVKTSHLIIENLPWIALFIFFSIVSFMLMLKNKRNKFYFDRFTIKIAILGKILKKVWIAKFCRTLSILLSGGVGLITALPISSDSANNLYLQGVIQNIKNNLISGASLSKSFKSEKVFPGILVKTIEVGEKTGKLSEMLERNADYFDRELESNLNAFTALFEPILIIFIGIIVGIIIVAFYLPIFKISTIVR